MSEKGDEKKESTRTLAMGSFSIDDGAMPSEMPSITRLLNRKSLGLGAKKEARRPAQKTPIPPSSPPPPPGSAPLTAPVPSEKPAPVSVRVQAASRRRGSAEALTIWQLDTLRSGTDPLGRGIASLIESGALTALFLTIQPPLSGAPTPTFKSTAVIQPRDHKLPLWTGFQWNPGLTPDVWSQFLKDGFVEFGPPETQTNFSSDRNMIRNAFGLERAEFLFLIRIGPAAACRGVLAVIASSSLKSAITQFLPTLAASAPAIGAA